MGLSVEFLGLPGVGKSAVSHRVAEILAAHRVPVDQPSYRLAHGSAWPVRFSRKLAHVLREVTLHPASAVRATRVIIASGQPSMTLTVKMLFNWLLISDLIRQGRRTRGVHLYDQGVFQGLWSIGLDGHEGSIDDTARRLAARLPRPDLVTLVEASLQSVQKRLDQRPGLESRMDSLHRERPHILARAATLLKATQATIGELRDPSGRPRFVAIENETPDDLEREAERLASMLQELSDEDGTGLL